MAVRFIIDGSEWVYPHMDSLSREEQLDSIREKVSAEGRVIVDMLSDGESLDEKDIMEVPDGIDVEIVTATPFGLGLEILEEVKDSLLSVFKAIQSALDGSKMFDPDDLGGAKEQLEWVCDAMDSFGDAYPDYAGRIPDAAPMSEAVGRFGELLADGRYADANAWHENTWKKRLLPPFLNDLKSLKEWLDAEEAKSGMPPEDAE